MTTKKPAPVTHGNGRFLVRYLLAAAASVRRASACGARAALLQRLHEHGEREDHREQGERSFRSAGDERAVGQEVRVVRGVQRDEGEEGVDRRGDVADDRAPLAART